MKNCSVIYNPVSAKFNYQELRECARILKESYQVELSPSDYAGHVEPLVKELNQYNDLIVSYGGDGTFGEVVRGMHQVKQKAAIAHIPTGTANDLRRTYGLSENPIESAKLIVNGQEKKLDIMTVNNYPYAYVAAFGFLANVPCDTPNDLKKRLGYLSYLLVGSKQVIKKPIPYNITYSANGRTGDIDAIIGIISNTKGFGGMNLFKDIKLDDGLFEVSLIRNVRNVDKLRLFRDIVSNKFDLNAYPDFITHFKTNKVSMVFNDLVPERNLDLDGDEKEIPYQPELTFKTNKQLKMILPR